MFGRELRAPPQHERQRAQADHEQSRRADPQQRGAGLERRAVANEVAIAVGHELHHLLVAGAAAQLLADLAAQVVGEARMRVGNGLVLAHQAAQLGGDAQQACFEHRIGRHRLGFLGHRAGAAQRQGQPQREPPGLSH
jgi:hypothetical protein